MVLETERNTVSQEQPTPEQIDEFIESLSKPLVGTNVTTPLHEFFANEEKAKEFVLVCFRLACIIQAKGLDKRMPHIKFVTRLGAMIHLQIKSVQKAFSE